MNINYHQLFKDIINDIKTKEITPKLLLHSCCAPCSTTVLERLSNYFNITIFYYNPNIDSEKEFTERANEQQRLINELKTKNPIKFILYQYDPKPFEQISNGLEHLKEGDNRCFKCYHLRMYQTAIYAKENNFDYFTTTLSISPHKNSQKLNEIGKQLEQELNINYLYADFKKENGYSRSIELSKKYQLYRQNYCGCIYSKTNNDKRSIK